MTEDRQHHFERRDHALNMRRFYRLAIEQDLFGTILVVREWGRIGTAGRRRTEDVKNHAAAVQAIEAFARRRRRRGYIPVA